MKQNKFVQIITILFSIIIQIGLFLFMMTNVHTSETETFDTSVLPQILQSYGLVILSIIVLVGIGYSGYYVKKHKQPWLTYIQENIISPLYKSLLIGCCIQVANICLLFITLLINLRSNELRQQLILLLNIVGITAVVTGFAGIVLEMCFIDKSKG